MFIDESRIYVEGGLGGKGCMSFLREKYRPNGGPDGGNGGKGGDVILMATENQNTLACFSSKRHFKAKPGKHGGSVHKHGAGADEFIVQVPVGTIIRHDQTKKILADLAVVGNRFVAAKGGRGGRGNARFACTGNPLPRFAEKGEPGKTCWLHLELRVMADVGLTGLPNAGKSTFIRRISAARPKVAAYPFTTLNPHLGVVSRPDHTSFVVADLPGLIEGAHEGVGLGDRFLKHLHRTRVILHLVDLFDNEDPAAAYHTIRQELEAREELADKLEIVVATKLDLGDLSDKLQSLKDALPDREVFAISSASGLGVDELLYRIDKILSEMPRTVQKDEAVSHFTLEPEWAASKDGNVFVVRGNTVERMVIMTDTDNPYAMDRMHRVLNRIGIVSELKTMGIVPGDKVRIGAFEFIHAPDEIPEEKRRKTRKERYPDR